MGYSPKEMDMTEQLSMHTHKFELPFKYFLKKLSAIFYFCILRYVISSYPVFTFLIYEVVGISKWLVEESTGAPDAQQAMSQTLPLQLA